MRDLGPSAVAEWLAGDAPPVLLDVREAWEVATAALPGASHIPMSVLPDRLAELDPTRPTVVLCHHGLRSARVGTWLELNGFAAVFNLAGGIDAWSRDHDPAVPRY